MCLILKVLCFQNAVFLLFGCLLLFFNVLRHFLQSKCTHCFVLGITSTSTSNKIIEKKEKKKENSKNKIFGTFRRLLSPMACDTFSFSLRLTVAPQPPHQTRTRQSHEIMNSFITLRTPCNRHEEHSFNLD